MPHFYNVLRRRYGKSRDGMTRREMLQATLAASAGLLVSNSVAFGQKPGRRVLIVGARLLGPRRGVRAQERRLRRHGARGAQPGRRARRHVHGPRAGQARRRRRRAHRLEPSDVGGLRREVQAFVPRRDRRGSRVPDRPRRQAAHRRGVGEALGGARRDGQRDERGRGEGDRRVSAVDDAGRRRARQADTRVVGGCAAGVAELPGGDRRDDERRQRRAIRVAELSRQPRHGEGRGPREVLDRQRGLSMRGRQPVARDAADAGDRTRARQAPHDRAPDRPRRERRPRDAGVGRDARAPTTWCWRCRHRCGARSGSSPPFPVNSRRRWARTSSSSWRSRARSGGRPSSRPTC